MKKILSEFRLYVCNNLISKFPSRRVRRLFYEKVMKFEIGKGTTIFMNVKFDCAEGLVIGNNSVINSNCRLDSRGRLEIGNNVSISEDVIILTADHNEDLLGVTGRSKVVKINDYVWVGTRAMILPGVNIAKGAVIGAGSVVTKSVDENAVVAGVPAKFIKTRTGSFEYTANYSRLFQ